MRQALAVLINKGGRLLVAFFQGLLADLELETLGADSAVARIDEALVSADQATNFASLPFLHRLRGDILLKRDPSDVPPAEEAYRTAIAVAKQQAARSYELLASLALAKLYQSTGRDVEAHAVLGPALVGFARTPEMPEIGEAQALLAALAEGDEVKAAEAQRQRRLHLQTAYGQAVMYSKGFQAEETKAAFARATELAVNSDDFSERFAAAHGQWTSELVRGQYKSARELASAFLREAEEVERIVEVGVARRGLAIISFALGEFAEAQTHCVRALETCDPERDREARERFSEDTGLIAMSWLGLTMWQLGEVDRARELVDIANRRAEELGHIPSMAHPLQQKFFLESLRGDPVAALAAAEALEVLGREHGMNHWRAQAELYAVWARCRLHDPSAAEALAEQGVRGGWFSKALLAELELQTHGADSALARIDEALALAKQIEQRSNLVFMYRLRGEILFRRDPASPAPAEEAFQRAIAIAKEQGARSWGLRAALSLAKLYQSTGRPADAHAVLVPALEGFSPTPEMPEIAEAQALLAELAEIEEVKAEATKRHRMTRLQVAYGNALIHDRGYGAAETTEAFARARESALGDDRTSERLAADYGLWAGSYLRGELAAMRAHAAVFLRDAEAKPDSPEASVAHRVLGTTHWIVGEYDVARDHLARAIALFRPGRDDDLAYRFGQDAGVAAMVHLAIALWQLGEVERAVSLIGGAEARIVSLTHIGTHVYAKFHSAILQAMRGDVYKVASSAFEFVRVVRAHDLRYWLPHSEFFEGWVKSAGGAPGDGLDDMRRGIELMDRPNFDAVFRLGLAEFEARAGQFERAIATLDKALATSKWSEQRAFDSQLHRLRGETLLQRDPANSGPAEEAFGRAIAVAREQGARSFGLQAALKLAKLYQLTSRPVEAHGILAPALKGFAPTPEMPEIAEALETIAAIEAGPYL
jgi:tetratricopeptide (TPR) repeat protein